MKAWYSASELTGMPGVPNGRPNIVRLANKNHWIRRPRSGRGGGYEYSFDALPKETQQHLREQYSAEVIQKLSEHEISIELDTEQTDIRRISASKFAIMPAGPQKERALAREWVVITARKYVLALTNKEKAYEQFCQAFNAYEMDIPEQHIQRLPHRGGLLSLSKSTLWRWEGVYQKHGIMGLVGKETGRAGTGKIDSQPKLKALVLGALVKYPHITAKKIRSFITLEYPELECPSVRRMQDWLAQWKQDNHQIWTYISQPDRWKSAYMPAHGSHTENVIALNQVWEIDDTPGDWLLKDGRHTVIGIIDLYSRRLKLLVTKTPTGIAACSLLRRTIMDWGVPQTLRTDNGKGYVGEQFSSALRHIEIHHQVCIPFASEQKGTIERTFRTMSHGILDLLPGFCGHNVAERKDIEARKSFAKRVMTQGENIEIEVTGAELQTLLDDWVEAIYHRDVHGGLKGRSPFEIAHEWHGPVDRINDHRALDMLLTEVAGRRTVQKKGIKFDHQWYIHPKLANIVGDEIELRRDPEDLGKLWVYGGDPWGFVCVAQCPELSGISRTEFAVAAKAEVKKLIAEQAKELRQHKRDLKQDIPTTVLRHRINESEKIAVLPRPHNDYSTPGLEAAGEAARATDAPVSESLSADEARHLQEFNSKPATVHEIDDPMHRHRRWLRIDQELKSGGSVQPAEHKFHEAYPKTPEYRSMQGFFEDFGESLTEEEAAR